MSLFCYYSECCLSMKEKHLNFNCQYLLLILWFKYCVINPHFSIKVHPPSLSSEPMTYIYRLKCLSDDYCSDCVSAITIIVFAITRTCCLLARQLFHRPPQEPSAPHSPPEGSLIIASRNDSMHRVLFTEERKKRSRRFSNWNLIITKEWLENIKQTLIKTSARPSETTSTQQKKELSYKS